MDTQKAMLKSIMLDADFIIQCHLMKLSLLHIMNA